MASKIEENAYLTPLKDFSFKESTAYPIFTPIEYDSITQLVTFTLLIFNPCNIP